MSGDLHVQPPVISHRAANLYNVGDATLFYLVNETTSVTQVSLCSEAPSDSFSMEYEFLKPQVASECVSFPLHIWNVPGSTQKPAILPVFSVAFCGPDIKKMSDITKRINPPNSCS